MDGLLHKDVEATFTRGMCDVLYLQDHTWCLNPALQSRCKHHFDISVDEKDRRKGTEVHGLLVEGAVKEAAGGG